MEVGRTPYEVLILVCTNLREDESRASCARRGSMEMFEEIKRRVKALPLEGRVRVSRAGCLDLCAIGPNVLVFPGGRLYSRVGPEDIDTILRESVGPLLV